MNDMTLWIDPISHRIGFAVVHSLWIIVGVAALLALLLRIIPSKHAVARHHFSMASLALMLMIWIGLFAFAPRHLESPRAESPSPTQVSELANSPTIDANNQSQLATTGTNTETTHGLPIPEPAGSETSESTSPADEPATASTAPANNISNQFTDGAMSFLAAFWILGLAMFSIRRIWSVVDLVKFRHGCQTVTDKKLLALISRAQERLQMESRIEIVESSKTLTPVVFGWLRPTLALPLGFLSGLPLAQADAIIAHELAHIKRYDYLLNLFQITVETLLFFHPLVWWVSRQIRIEREHCCDDVAIGSGCASIELAQAIVDYEQRRKELALAFSDTNTSAARVKRLLAVESIRSHSLISTALVALGNLIFCGAIVSLSLHSPSIAQGQQDEAEPKVDRVLYLGYQASWTGRFLYHGVKSTGDEFVSFPLNSDINNRKYSRRCNNVIKQLPNARALVIHEWELRDESRSLQEAIVEGVKSGKLKLVVLPSAENAFGISNNKPIPELAELLPFKKYCCPSIEAQPANGKIEFVNFDDHVEMDLYQLAEHIELRNQATVLGTFTIGNKSQPLIINRRSDQGTVGFIATSDLWRLRERSPELHQHIWTSLLGLPTQEPSEEEKEKLVDQIHALESSIQTATTNLEQARATLEELNREFAQATKDGDENRLKTLLSEIAETESTIVATYSNLLKAKVRLGEKMEAARILDTNLSQRSLSNNGAQQKTQQGDDEIEKQQARAEARKLVMDLAEARKQVVEKEYAFLTLREESKHRIAKLESEIAQLQENLKQSTNNHSQDVNALQNHIDKLSEELKRFDIERQKEKLQEKEQEDNRSPNSAENQDLDVSNALEAFDDLQRYPVTGVVIDAFGEPVANSVIIPWTTQGSPLAKSNGLPASLDDFSQALQQEVLLTATTDSEGKFELELFPGEYRLVAQTWQNLDKSVENILARNGKLVRLDGIHQFRVSTTANDNKALVIEPAGNCTLEVQTNNSSPLLLVSTGKLSADPILGFAGWSSDFFTGLLGGNQMHDRKTTFSGLPAGKIQLAAFANDNNPGFGGLLVELTDNETRSIELPIIASWSNGHKTPPERLQGLVEYMSKNPDDVEKIMEIVSQARDADSKNPVMIFLKLATFFGEQFELSDGSSHSAKDCLAAVAYLKLR